MDSKQESAPGKASGRRRFLEQGALAGLAAAGGMAAFRGQGLSTLQDGAKRVGSMPQESVPKISRWGKDLIAYGERSRFVTSVRATGGPLTPRSPLQDQMGIITPASLHFYQSHRAVSQTVVPTEGWSPLAPPDIDPKQHRLLIHGLVDRPLIFTLEELQRLPSVSRIHFIECAVNSGSSGSAVRTGTAGMRGRTVQETHGYTSCSEWMGVLLSVLLQEAGVQRGGSWIIAEGAEPSHWTKSIPMEKALDDCLVAYGQNGEPVRPEQGYPLRLVVPGFEGVNNIKWLRRIRVVDQPYMFTQESVGYVSLRPDGKGRWFQFEMPPISVITRPSGGQQLGSRGFYEIIGLAWSGQGAIRRVEVSTDGGRTWKDAQLQKPVHRKAHTLFRSPWYWDGHEVVLQSRCTDELGTVQPTLAELSRFWGVSLDYWLATSNYINHFNPIWSWKVAKDGSVHNALFES